MNPRAAHGGSLLGARVDGRLELSLIFPLEKTNDAVVLELLADRPHEDWAHTPSDASTGGETGRIRRPKGLNIA